MVEIKNQIDVLKNNLTSLKDISFYSFKEDDNVQGKVSSLKIDLALLSHMNSGAAKAIVEEVNRSLDKVLGNIGMLQGEINQQKIEIQRTIKKHKEEINSFLKYAGYDYHVDIEEDGNSYKMRLRHKDWQKSIENSSQHLSFGERNAFSLVLFMYESLSKSPDLIILDDPISSFDKNKKFAIVEMLFRRQNSFKGKTVFMVTHDLEPIVDMLSTLRGIFQPLPCASFLNNRDGVLTEVSIEKKDIISFGQVCIKNMKSNKQDLIKLIYLRRYCEIVDDRGEEYHILSSLLHKRPIPTYDQEGTKQMPEDKIKIGEEKIKERISSFKYGKLLGLLKDKDTMVSLYKRLTNNYEKLQIFRIICDDTSHESGVIQKFINETFHIENEYIMQLNPSKYDFIPQYIISECDRMLATKK
ncbi:AAA family ATPase [Candidatus Nitrospira salsa]